MCHRRCISLKRPLQMLCAAMNINNMHNPPGCPPSTNVSSIHHLHRVAVSSADLSSKLIMPARSITRRNLRHSKDTCSIKSPWTTPSGSSKFIRYNSLEFSASDTSTWDKMIPPFHSSFLLSHCRTISTIFQW